MKLEARNIYYLFEDNDRYAKEYIEGMDYTKVGDEEFFNEQYQNEMQYIEENRVWSYDTDELDGCDEADIRDYVISSIEDEIGNIVVDYDLYIDGKKID